MSKKAVLSSQINPDFKKQNQKAGKSQSLIKQSQSKQLQHQDQPSQIKFYEIEQIVDRKMINKVTHYLVKWVGETEKTWEPISHLIEGMGFIAKFEKQLKLKSKELRNQKKAIKSLASQSQPNLSETAHQKANDQKMSPFNPLKKQSAQKPTERANKPKITLEISDSSQLSDQSQIQQKKTPQKIKKQQKVKKIEQKKNAPNKKKTSLQLKNEQKKGFAPYTEQAQLASFDSKNPSKVLQNCSSQKLFAQDKTLQIRPTTRRQTKIQQETKSESMNVQVDSAFYPSQPLPELKQVSKVDVQNSFPKRKNKPDPKEAMKQVYADPIQPEIQKNPASKADQQKQPEAQILKQSDLQNGKNKRKSRTTGKERANKKKQSIYRQQDKASIQKGDLPIFSDIKSEGKQLAGLSQKKIQNQEKQICNVQSDDDKIVRSKSTNLKIPIQVKTQNYQETGTSKSQNNSQSKLTRIQKIDEIDEGFVEVGKSKYLVEYNDEILTKFTANQMKERHPTEFIDYLLERCGKLQMRRC